jgi:hypothetical protein
MINSNKKNKNNIGLSILGLVVVLAIGLLVLSYFKISVRSVVESPTGQDNIGYVKGTSQSVWQRYLAKPAHYLWQDVWIDIFWKSFILNMQRIRDGEPTDITNAAPILAPVNTGR